MPISCKGLLFEDARDDGMFSAWSMLGEGSTVGRFPSFAYAAVSPYGQWDYHLGFVVRIWRFCTFGRHRGEVTVQLAAWRRKLYAQNLREGREVHHGLPPDTDSDGAGFGYYITVRFYLVAYFGAGSTVGRFPGTHLRFHHLVSGYYLLVFVSHLA